MPITGKEISIYFHIPFCSKKCPYCHFFVLPDEPRFKEPFVPALIQEWHLRVPQLQGNTIVSIYFGGGTPTKLPPSAYALLLDTIRSSGITIAPDCEITLEANPEDVSCSLMQEFKSVGINRVSLGVQSLIDTELVMLERTHASSGSIRAIDATHNAGIRNISIDLLFDLPNQTALSWKRTLEQLKTLPITHLSLYNLVLEPHTHFFKRRQEITPLLPTPTESLDLLNEAIIAIEQLGLKRYEISAFAKPGYESRHNKGYWTGRPFLGLGPSAFSYWEGKRFSNTKKFHTYLNLLKEKTLPVDFEEKLPFPNCLHELFAVQLRLLSGIDLPQWRAMHGPLPPGLLTQISLLQTQGLLESTHDTVRLTDLGHRFYDDVASTIIIYTKHGK